ncbi:unnamed protein product [Knipowitschia caucasica]|uniref:Kinesin motor domain-containing protein n=1 Tax=Knipowitschia caucasica TaxID=637954 RepID=A0AAV2L1P1_KNICA
MGSGASVNTDQERGGVRENRGDAKQDESRVETSEAREEERKRQTPERMKEVKEVKEEEEEEEGMEEVKRQDEARVEEVKGETAEEQRNPQTPQSTRPGPRSSSPAAHSDDTVKAESPDCHVLDVQSLKSQETNLKTSDDCEDLETEEKTSEGPQAAAQDIENEELSLVFESFLHNNGMLYSCFNHHGNRVYVDETQKLQSFPQEWHSQGHFISPGSEGFLQQRSSSDLRDDDRSSSTHLQGRGTVTTYWFEERVNVCRFWDPQAGIWLLLPLQWELNLDFVQKVMAALPGLVDQKEIAAALRLCNYDSEEVVSVYLTLFGEILLQPAPKDFTDLSSFGALLERDRVIETLRRDLQTKEKEVEALIQRNSYLKKEARYHGDVIQHLNHRLAELEADQQGAQQRIRSLLSHRAPAIPALKASPKPAVDPVLMKQVCTLTRELKVWTMQLRSTVLQTMKDLRNQLQEVREAAESRSQQEELALGQVQELRALYQREATERKSLYNKVMELQGNIRVFCRCRWTSRSERCLEESPDQQEVAVIQKGNRKKLQFDKVYGCSSTQEEVFAGTLPVIRSCVDGYNVCILAYGQTGSGKTYTMMGTKEQPGVNIRSIPELLRICAEREKVSYTLKMSMLEIYNETLNDLLTPGSSLDLRVQGKSVSVPGLTQVQVQTEADILSTMETGEKNRKIAATQMNTQSSRSHLVVALEVEGSDAVSGLTSRGALTLCDLAGSERISKTEATGQRLVEAAAINRSLTALGQVFSALKCNSLHVPFRNSKLTRLLQPALSGDAKCCVFVNVSPDVEDVTETLSSLQFGSSVRQVSLGKASQNITPTRTKNQKN